MRLSNYCSNMGMNMDVNIKKELSYLLGSLIIYNTMLCSSLKCRVNTESKNPKVVKTKNGSC